MRAAIYTRVSTPEQAKRHGTEYQRRELAAFVEARGWELVEIIADEGLRAQNTERPGLVRVHELARTRKIDVVVIWRLDRMFRSVRELLNVVEEYRALGVELAVTGQPVDTTTPAGKALFAVQAIFAELESDIARERTLAGLENARAQGRPLGGAAHKNRLRITAEQAAAAVKQHGSIRAAGRALKCSSTSIHRALAREVTP